MPEEPSCDVTETFGGLPETGSSPASMYCQILDSAGAAIFVVDAERRLRYANNRTATFFGLLPAGLIGVDYLSLVAEPDRSCVSQKMDALLRGEIDLIEEERRYLRRDGRLLWGHITGRRFTDVAGNITGLVGLITDVTERERFQAEAEQFEAIIRSSEDAIISKSLQGIVTSWNPAAEKIFGYSAHEMIGQPMLRLFPENRRHEEEDILNRIRQGEGVRHFETVRRHRNGREIHISATISPVYGPQGEIIGVSKIARDITAEKLAEARLCLAASVFTHAREGITITDSSGKVLEVNESFLRITGYGVEEIVGRNPRVLKSGRHGPDFYEAMWRSIRETGYWSGEIWNRRKSGEIFPELLTIVAVCDGNRAVQNYIGLFSDISVQKEEQHRLVHLAQYDALTDLPNRLLLVDRLRQSMAVCLRRKGALAVAYIDLDGFKLVNDTYGHEAGDKLLITVARRLRDALREGDTLARVGGDEFVALLCDLQKSEECEPILERLLQAAAAPVALGDGFVVHVTASVGVASYPQQVVDGNDLIAQADLAMYSAKNSGKNRYRFFEPDDLTPTVG